MYISDKITVNEYGSWMSGEKVIISAPTGTGKTTFITTKLISYCKLPVCKLYGKKMLILCNRKLLQRQYDFDLSRQYLRYQEAEEDVEVMTYQQLGAELRAKGNLYEIMKEFDVIVADECHFFYADSDFNPFDTYILLQELVKVCFFKTMIFVTATLEEVKPLLEQTLKKAEEILKDDSENRNIDFDKYRYKGKIYDFSDMATYKRFSCKYSEDIETICNNIINSGKKAVIFIDDVEKAKKFREKLIEIGKLESTDVKIISSTFIEDNPNDLTVTTLAVANKVLPRVLITTSVLDNGVSIHDSDVGTVVIATDSRISFIQMLGRIRAESNDGCILYVYPRDYRYYERRIRQSEQRDAWFKEIEELLSMNKGEKVLNQGWYDKAEKAEFIRNSTVIVPEKHLYYKKEKAQIYLSRGSLEIGINFFAKEKNGNQLLQYRRFYKKALTDKILPAMEQFSWINKTAEEIEIIESSYRENREEDLKKELLEIDNIGSDELQLKKTKIADRYRKEFFADIVVKSGSYENRKLAKVCERFGLRFVDKKDTKGLMKYWVLNQGEELAWEKEIGNKQKKPRKVKVQNNEKK